MKKTGVNQRGSNVKTKNKKVVSKSSYSAVRKDGSNVNVRKKTTWDNSGTKQKPILTNQRSRTKTTVTSVSGKKNTTVRKVNSQGVSKSRKSLTSVKK